jgi:hypothetical protein
MAGFGWAGVDCEGVAGIQVSYLGNARILASMGRDRGLHPIAP